jgi:ATP-dependent Clp protease ATP-binding subunit ClpX
LGGTSNIGAVKVTPKMLKQHLDQYVVDQERAKKVLSTAVYNHYQRIQDLERQEDEHAELLAKEARKEMARRHPLEGKKKSISPDSSNLGAALNFV